MYINQKYLQNKLQSILNTLNKNHQRITFDDVQTLWRKTGLRDSDLGNTLKNFIDNQIIEVFPQNKENDLFIKVLHLPQKNFNLINIIDKSTYFLFDKYFNYQLKKREKTYSREVLTRQEDFKKLNIK